MAILDYEYDAQAISPEIKRGIDFLYEAADRKEAVDAWAGSFSKEGKLIKGDFQPVGVPALRDYMADSWNNTDSRVHDVKKVSVLQASPLTLKIEGVTTYQRSTGKEQQGTWSAEQSYVKEDGMQKISEYKISFNMLY
ncbi:uncharacterized protein B0I36DRAFT_356972 [Microdochium trichocladiopsis]|uniref:SnoaL-like domain-containing protein n=1 Tax=Microdochium trichocladiopsis TaxID=1682393 RepID=A0A9P8YFS0_9PEZI|nr:uncharacterized protein B0I36DRAFT_356972 [Microdochium trichocladiopsis]KAH7039559.1 hypothetical protein B0I36DRAFT_356972 [Microdochium trichocladiopsis]